MTGGTLFVSRAEPLFPYIETQFEKFGFAGFSVTGEEKDSLNYVIAENKPRLVLVESSFYCGSTPYMMRKLLDKFPKLNIAALSFLNYPDDLAMRFIVNGVKSYANMYAGMDEFRKGLEAIRDGREYIAPGVQRRIEMRKEFPEAARELTPRHIEIARLLGNAFSTVEIADTLHISVRTVEKDKQEIYRRLNIRNENEIIRVGLFLDLIKPGELIFFGRNYQLNPKPEKKSKLKIRRTA
jgi:DNA-binding NarL/FixJ family response regulator